MDGFRRLLLIGLSFLFCFSLAIGEEAPPIAEGYVTDGVRTVRFSYPAACNLESDGWLDAFIYLPAHGNLTDYVSIALYQKHSSGVAALHENIGDMDRILPLSDTLHLFADRGDHQPFFFYPDIVSVGADLPEGTGVVVTAFCSSQQPDVYHVLLSVLQSMTDAQPLADWLQQQWLPTAAP